RQWDIAREPFAGTAALTDHLDATAGSLMWLAACALGAPPEAEPVIRAAGRASGLAAWLRATPALIARGRQPLPDTSEAAIAALATEALNTLASARKNRGRVPKSALPALLTGWQTTHILRLAAAKPARVANGALTLSDFTRRRILATRGITGRW
ncbi:MAG: phytoene synthase, partial [Paracoccaceae bacterium]|nr:phytoene synthase [Paracoccaceae bacterium]